MRGGKKWERAEAIFCLFVVLWAGWRVAMLVMRFSGMLVS